MKHSKRIVDSFESGLVVGDPFGSLDLKTCKICLDIKMTKCMWNIAQREIAFGNFLNKLLWYWSNLAIRQTAYYGVFAVSCYRTRQMLWLLLWGFVEIHYLQWTICLSFLEMLRYIINQLSILLLTIVVAASLDTRRTVAQTWALCILRCHNSSEFDYIIIFNICYWVNLLHIAVKFNIDLRYILP